MKFIDWKRDIISPIQHRAFFMSLKLRSIANNMTSAVNPNHKALIKVSNGYDVGEDGSQIPKYQSHESVLQLQSMSSQDLDHFGFANKQAMYVYAYGDEFFEIIDRINQVGNTLVETTKYGSQTTYVWQVVRNAEPWFDWSKAVLQLVGKKIEGQYFGFSSADMQTFNQGVFAP